MIMIILLKKKISSPEVAELIRQTVSKVISKYKLVRTFLRRTFSVIDDMKFGNRCYEVSRTKMKVVDIKP